jgi:hypothetical protein
MGQSSLPFLYLKKIGHIMFLALKFTPDMIPYGLIRHCRASAEQQWLAQQQPCAFQPGPPDAAIRILAFCNATSP